MYHEARRHGPAIPVVGGEVGFPVNNVEECADRVLYPLWHPEGVQRMGAAGREHVRRHFLTTRYLADYLHLFGRLSVG